MDSRIISCKESLYTYVSQLLLSWTH